MTRFVVVGIGADGWAGLSEHARTQLRSATEIVGSVRQLALLPADLGAATTPWRSPMSEHLQEVLAGDSGAPEQTVHVLASGDPMLHGIGSTIVKALGADRVTVLPAPSSISLAAARLGWDLAATRVLSLVTAEPEALIGALTDGARLLVLSRDGQSPGRVADLLRRTGFDRSEMTVLGDLGGPGETIAKGPARTWRDEPSPALNVLAIDCVGPATSRAPGLADAEFAHDGQLTKQAVRAVTVAALAPAEGQLLWDVGAGSGSVGIEWLRQTTTGRVIAFEADPERADRITANARRHGVADRLSVAGAAPAALAGAPGPDTVFIGGGLDGEVLAICREAIAGGGRLVANAVTLETEQLLVAAHAEDGGTLTRLQFDYASALGSKTAWRPTLPVVQWVVTR